MEWCYIIRLFLMNLSRWFGLVWFWTSLHPQCCYKSLTVYHLAHSASLHNLPQGWVPRWLADPYQYQVEITERLNKRKWEMIGNINVVHVYKVRLINVRVPSSDYALNFMIKMISNIIYTSLWSTDWDSHSATIRVYTPGLWGAYSRNVCLFHQHVRTYDHCRTSDMLILVCG